MSKNKPYRHTVTTEAVAWVPFSVTKVVDILIAICNRNDTPKIVGERNRTAEGYGYIIPISLDVMEFLLGTGLARNFVETLKNPAYNDYYRRVVERLSVVEMTLMPSEAGWFLCRPVRDHVLPIHSSEQYTMADFEAQQPHGYPRRAQLEEQGNDNAN